MWFIGYTEWHGKDPDVHRAINDEIQEERKKYPDRYPKKLLHQDGTPISFTIACRIGHGFNLYEASEEQLANLSARWFPEMTWKFVPIIKGIGEAYDKLNK